jgi:hypothetical protein
LGILWEIASPNENRRCGISAKRIPGLPGVAAACKKLRKEREEEGK